MGKGGGSVSGTGVAGRSHFLEGFAVDYIKKLKIILETMGQQLLNLWLTSFLSLKDHFINNMENIWERLSLGAGRPEIECPGLLVV